MGRVFNIKWILYLLLVFTRGIGQSEANVPGLFIRFVVKSTNVAQFAYQLSSFLGLGGGGSGDISNTELVERIDELIQKSSVSILSALLDIPKVDRIYDSVSSIHSSMQDLRLIVQSPGNTTLAKQHKEEFVKRFGEHGVVEKIRYLPQLLTDTIPGFDVPLLEQVKEKTNCKAESLANFRDFYVNLLSNGIALHATYEEFTKSSTLEYVLESEWNKSLEKVQEDFDTIERECYAELYEKAMRVCSSSGTEGSGHGVSWRVLVIGMVTGFMATTTGTPLF